MTKAISGREISDKHKQLMELASERSRVLVEAKRILSDSHVVIEFLQAARQQETRLDITAFAKRLGDDGCLGEVEEKLAVVVADESIQDGLYGTLISYFSERRRKAEGVLERLLADRFARPNSRGLENADKEA